MTPHSFFRTFILSGFIGMWAFLPSNLAAQAVSLSLPYVSQVPDGIWVSPWDEACEEASITMVDGFYRQQRTIKTSQAKRAMQKMFDWESKNFPSKDDTDAEQTSILIRHHATFRGTIKRSPTMEEIKEELNQQRPVIALVNMYQLYQEPSQGDSYHVLVISGYDDEKQEFIVHDPARERQRYAYETLMGALHDYDEKTREASGPPTVLFTELPSERSRGVLARILSFFKNIFS